METTFEALTSSFVVSYPLIGVEFGLEVVLGAMDEMSPRYLDSCVGKLSGCVCNDL